MDFTLHSGRKIPAIAFGTGTTYFHRNKDVTEGILKAFDNGYRLFDTAQIYKTEEGVGEALEILFKEKGVKRNEVYVTTKVWHTENTYEKVINLERARSSSYS